MKGRLYTFIILAGLLSTSTFAQDLVPAPNEEPSSIKIDGKDPLYILDNRAIDTSVTGLQAINPEDIEAIEVVKGDYAAEKYGKRLAKNGIVMITSRSGDLHKKYSENYLTIGDGQPVYIVNGERVTKKSKNPIKDLDPNDIESIEVLKGFDNVEKYGEKAVNGVILISTQI